MIYICENATTTTCISEASSSPMFINGFSYDGILTNLFLFLIFSLYLFSFFYNMIFGVKIQHRKYE